MPLVSQLAPLALAAFLAMGGSAQAAITVFTTQASFMLASGSTGTDTFDNLDPTSTLATPLVRMAGSYAYTATSGPTNNFFPSSDGGTDIYLSTTFHSDTITFTGFAPGVTAIGANFFSTDLVGLFTNAPSITITATDASGTVTQTLLNPTVNSFMGFVSSGGLSSLTVTTGDALGFWPSVNNLTLGMTAAVPEPSTYALLLSGLAVLGFTARRKQQP